jgi:hypothetical protein
VTDQLPEVRKTMCAECPWSRQAAPGWLGPYTAEEWCEIAHGEQPIACHVTIRDTDDDGHGDWDQPGMKQCAGAAQFRTNVGKLPRRPDVATADAPDIVTVFAWDDEFRRHHAG